MMGIIKQLGYIKLINKINEKPFKKNKGRF